jgi:hypothetical protein
MNEIKIKAAEKAAVHEKTMRRMQLNRVYT